MTIDKDFLLILIGYIPLSLLPSAASDSLGGSTSTGLRSEAVRNADIEDYVAGAAVLQVLR